MTVGIYKMNSVVPQLSNWKNIAESTTYEITDKKTIEIFQDYVELVRDWITDWEDNKAMGSDLERELEKRKDSILYAYATRSVEEEEEIYYAIELDCINDLIGILN